MCPPEMVRKLKSLGSVGLSDSFGPVGVALWVVADGDGRVAVLVVAVLVTRCVADGDGHVAVLVTWCLQ